MPDHLTDILTLAGFLAGLMLALEIGFRLGRRAAQDGEAGANAQIGVVQGALLGLLGLLLGFSFSAAGSRFLEKQDLILQEANAIGTATLRADVLDEPHRTALVVALKRYAEHRVELTQRLPFRVEPADLAEADRLHGVIWRAAIDGVASKPTAAVSVLPPVNDVIDLHATRLASGQKHIPKPVMALLTVCSLLAIGVIGYGCGVGKRRRVPLTVPLAVLIGSALWITHDLDFPRQGWIRLSDAPLQALKFGPP